MRRLCGNTTPFYIRDLSLLGIWCPGVSWNQGPEDTEGWLYCVLEAKIGSPRGRAPTRHMEKELQLTDCHPHLYLQIICIFRSATVPRPRPHFLQAALNQWVSLAKNHFCLMFLWSKSLLTWLRCSQNCTVVRHSSSLLPSVLPHRALHCRLKLPTSRVPAKTNNDLYLLVRYCLT